LKQLELDSKRLEIFKKCKEFPEAYVILIKLPLAYWMSVNARSKTIFAFLITSSAKHANEILII